MRNLDRQKLYVKPGIDKQKTCKFLKYVMKRKSVESKTKNEWQTFKAIRKANKLLNGKPITESKKINDVLP